MPNAAARVIAAAIIAPSPAVLSADFAPKRAAAPNLISSSRRSDLDLIDRTADPTACRHENNPAPRRHDTLPSGIGFGESPTNARLVYAEAPRDLDLALGPACLPDSGLHGRARVSKNGRESRTRSPRRLGNGPYLRIALKTYGPPVCKGFCRDRRLISLLQRIRPRRSPPGQDGDTRAPVLINLFGVVRRFQHQAS